MAYGTPTIPKVDKIFGPGNRYVTEAKLQVAQDGCGVAIDLPAGPSEVMVVADSTANPAWVAADLLAQAEHDPTSQVILVALSAQLAHEVVIQVSTQLSTLSRQSICRQALANSQIVVVEDQTSALGIIEEYAPEHLILSVEQPRQWLDFIGTAGSVFLGSYTPESLGDYCSGTNHVLPTYGYARSYSGLTLKDFTRTMTVQEATYEGLKNLGPTAIVLAELEGLDAHARAVSMRLEQGG
jgi:histidinol dehydrogenase